MQKIKKTILCNKHAGEEKKFSYLNIAPISPLNSAIIVGIPKQAGTKYNKAG